MLSAVLLAAACGPLPGTSQTTHVDYVDFVTWSGRTYLANYQAGRPIGDVDLGPFQFRVKRALSGSGTAPDDHPVDGDAAYLLPGEPVYAMIGYSPTFRLAAHRDGRIVLYEVDTNPQARTGRDLLDIEGKVRTIEILSKTDETTVIGRIDDPASVGSLVERVVNAPINAAQQGSGQLSGFVLFALQDGTASSRAYFADAHVLGRGIVLPPEVAAAIGQLIASAPTPTPIPATINFAQHYGLASALRVYIKPFTGVVPTPAPIRSYISALDVELPTLMGTVPSTYTVVGFEFSDHYIAFAYDPSANTLTVVNPPDNIAVRPTQQFRELLK